MRLWHYKLLPYLPRLQLISQYKECCCIMQNLNEKGTPNHILVNKILDYPMGDFFRYTIYVIEEMKNRGYKVNESKFLDRYKLYAETRWREIDRTITEPAIYEIYKDWHNDRYLKQCYYNLQEKYDCGGITKEEWEPLHNFITNYFKEEL